MQPAFLRKLPFFFLFLVIYSIQAQAPDDAVRIVAHQWKIIQPDHHITWQQGSFDSLFNSRQNINLLRTKLHNKKIWVAFASAGKALRLTSDLAAETGAVAAVNGTFFDTRNGGSVDLIKIDGVVLDTTRFTPGKPRAEHQKAAIAIGRRKVRIVKGDGSPGWDRRLKARNVMVTGPLLLYRGETQPLARNAFNDNRHPRTCACITSSNELILMTVDGRNAQAQGMSLPELTYLLRQLGCRNAINLDGGGSTTMWIGGQSDNGVVNRPSDNKQFDNYGERPVSNVILLKVRK